MSTTTVGKIRRRSLESDDEGGLPQGATPGGGVSPTTTSISMKSTDLLPERGKIGAKAGDSVIEWEVLPDNTVKVTTGSLAAQHESYRLAVVNVERCPVPASSGAPQPSPSLAELEAKIGRMNPTTFLTQHIFTEGVKPLQVYFVGYCEDDLWHWQLLEVPIRVIVHSASPTGFTLHFDFDHNPEVLGLKVLATSNIGFKSDREHELDMLEIDDVTGFQVASLRSLTSCTGYTVTAWPIYAFASSSLNETGNFGGSAVSMKTKLGIASLPVKVCTLPPVSLSVEEIGDTYLRITYSRPRWNGPVRRGVSDEEAGIGEALLHVWEDPIPSLLQNAKRLSNGRMPQRYPLQRREILTSDIPVGEERSFVVEGLKSNAAHFIMLSTRTRTEQWDAPTRLRVRTCHELSLINQVRISRSTMQLQWQRRDSEPLPFFAPDVIFPDRVNLFDDREVAKPYIGDKTINLFEDTAWGKVDGLLCDINSYDVSLLNVETNKCIIRKTTTNMVDLSGLEPSSVYYARVRCVVSKPAEEQKHSEDGKQEIMENAPWSRPWLIMTPSDVLLRVIHRSSSTLTLMWGRHLSPPVQPLPYPPGHPKYLPDANAESGDHYYYLEPLPYIPPKGSKSLLPPEETETPRQFGGDEEHMDTPREGGMPTNVNVFDATANAGDEPEDFSDSEEEENVFDSTAGVGYLGSRARILNREPRPDQLVKLPIEVTDSADTKVVVLVLKGEIHDTVLEALCDRNVYEENVPEKFAAVYEVVHRTESSQMCGELTVENLEGDSPYTVLVFSVAPPNEHGFTPFTLSAKHIPYTLSNKTVPHDIPVYDVNSQALWCGLAMEQTLKPCPDGSLPKFVPQLSTIELSEVFVTLKIEVEDPDEVYSSVGSSILHAQAQEDSITSEYLVRIEKVEMQNDSIVPVGDPTYTYFCTSSSEIQVVNLYAATQYHLTAARMDNRTQQWSEWSPVLGLTTVQKLLMEIDEVSSEYLKLKWNRNKMDSIVHFILTIDDIHRPQNVAPSKRRSIVNKEDLDRDCADDDEQEQEVEVLDDDGNVVETHTTVERRGADTKVHQLLTTKTTHRLAVLRDLRHNALFDCSVIPKYENGQLGLSSNPVRFLHCIIDARVVECGVSHLFVEWDKINYPDASTGTLMLRLRQGDDWERTVVLPGDETQHIFANLNPLTEYTLNVSYIAVVHRHAGECPDPRDVIKCTQPFSLKGTTLTQPTAEVHKLGESCVYLTWTFYAEENHEGEVVMEVKFVDHRKAESFQIFAKCHSKMGESIGEGRANIEGLLPERLYVVTMRQQYNRGTWGEWKKVLDGVSTLRRIEVEATSAGCTFLSLRAFRPPWSSSLGTHESMSRAEQINPPLWKFKVENMSNGEVIEKEVKEAKVVVRELEPNIPYILSVQQWSIEDWGEPSPPQHIYTLQQLVPVINIRADNYLDIIPARDRRLPSMSTQLCTWHDEASANAISSLKSVTIVAKSLLDANADPVTVKLEGDEASLTADSGTLRGLMPAHPYRVDLTPEYAEDEEGQEAPYLSAVATVTLGLPDMSVVNLGEDSFSVVWVTQKVTATHYNAFSGLPPAVRHAPRDGTPATVHSWEVRAVPVESQHLHLETPETSPEKRHTESAETLDASPEEGALTTSSNRSSARGSQHRSFFQDSSLEELIVAVDESATMCTMRGLMPETKYYLSIRSVDEHGNKGWFLPSGFVKTARFAQIHINKLAENFAELAWEIPQPRKHISAAGGAAKQKVHRTRSERRDLTYVMDSQEGESNNAPPDRFELLVIDLSAPVNDETPTTVVDIHDGHVLIENLKPRNRYAVVGRTHCTVQGVTVKGTWGPQILFETLALLVLRVVHVGLDFVNVTWHGVDEEEDEEEDDDGPAPLQIEHGSARGMPSPTGSTSSLTSTPNRSSKRNARREEEERRISGDIQFPPTLQGASTFFCVASGSSGIGSSASAVRFQLRVMDADSEGEIGDLKEDMFVTTADDNIHTIRNLLPKTTYAVSMRVCYEGISGSWVDPAIIMTDWVPDAKVVRITQSSGEFRYRVENALTHPRVEEPIPERRNRLYEIRVEENETPNADIYSAITGNEPVTLRLGNLKRDYLYHVVLREVINGKHYGGFTHLTTFWTQPYPPIVTELAECRDGFAHVHWGVMNNERIGEILSGDDAPAGFVYSFERGIRNLTTGAGSHWEEVAITEEPHCRFQWKRDGTAISSAGSPTNAASTAASPSAAGSPKAGENEVANSTALSLPSSVGRFQNIPFHRLCFRVRLSKLFVLEEGNTFKTPVWGDYSQLAVWQDPSPPSPVRKLQVYHLSDTNVIVQWQLPENFQHQPKLVFNVTIDASRARLGAGGKGTTTKAEWFNVCQTNELFVKIDDLAPNSVYRVAVRGESAFGVAETNNILTFTTRSIPNPDKVVPPKLIPEAVRESVMGLPPTQLKKETTNNLHDKYEMPKQRRLKALSALAGIATKSKKPSTLITKWQMCARKAIVVSRAIQDETFKQLLQPNFNPNEDLTPLQTARKNLGMDPFTDDVVWNDVHFRLSDLDDIGGFPDMAVAATFGVMAKKKEQERDGVSKRSGAVSANISPRPASGSQTPSVAAKRGATPINNKDDDVSWVPEQQGQNSDVPSPNETAPPSKTASPSSRQSKHLAPIKNAPSVSNSRASTARSTTPSAASKGPASRKGQLKPLPDRSSAGPKKGKKPGSATPSTTSNTPQPHALEETRLQMMIPLAKQQRTGSIQSVGRSSAQPPEAKSTSALHSETASIGSGRSANAPSSLAPVALESVGSSGAGAQQQLVSDPHNVSTTSGFTHTSSAQYQQQDQLNQTFPTTSPNQDGDKLPTDLNATMPASPTFASTDVGGPKAGAPRRTRSSLTQLERRGSQTESLGGASYSSFGRKPASMLALRRGSGDSTPSSRQFRPSPKQGLAHGVGSFRHDQSGSQQLPPKTIAVDPLPALPRSLLKKVKKQQQRRLAILPPKGGVLSSNDNDAVGVGSTGSGGRLTDIVSANSVQPSDVSGSPVANKKL